MLEQLCNLTILHRHEGALALGADSVNGQLAIEEVKSLFLSRFGAHLQDGITAKLNGFITANTN
jgi:hypothetical protein